MKVLQALLLAATGVAWAVAWGTVVPADSGVSGAPLTVMTSRCRRGRGVD